ncbi:family 31 carbohydrate-binding protein [Agarivorans sp. Alg241-V36]|uniref:family 31 carbohydrate-binding protein n=1 Tax=Agarivorans sp. Alg241-V36 TaxID=2305992 RepID=UPI0013D825D3|nr:family 31 carbohydrate-binding protein [Agarivorans sp. Alg241-V36]
MTKPHLKALALAIGISMPMLGYSAVFEPSDGRLFTVGQDVDSINQMHNDTSINAGGVTGYVGIASLDGLHGNADAGAGRNNLDELASLYPDRAMVVGISMNGQVSAVANGTYNDNITNLLETLASYDRPVYLRWAYEVDGPWNGHNQADLIRSWQYVHGRIQEMGIANKIAMVWQVASYCPNPRGQLESWYPGNQYVDWIGLSYFAPQDCNWDAVNEAANFAKAKGKPLFINEASPQRYQIADLNYSSDPAQGTNRQSKTAQQIWQEWFTPFFNFIEQYDVKAITYINADWDNQTRWGDFGDGYGEGYWGDSRVQANNEIEQNFTQQINDGSWLLQSNELFEKLAYGETPTEPEEPVDPEEPIDPEQPIDPEEPIDPRGDQGISYVDDDSLVVYHKDMGWSASWNYLCLDAYCIPGTLVDGFYQVQFDNVNLGQSYNIQFKVQDNANGQFISQETTVMFNKGSQTPDLPEEPAEPEEPTEPEVPVEPEEPNEPGTLPNFGIVGLTDNSFKVVRLNEGWTAGFVYMCVNSDCRVPSLVDGYYQYQWNGSIGSQYNISFKVQDNSVGQVIEEATATFN